MVSGIIQRVSLNPKIRHSIHNAKLAIVLVSTSPVCPLSYNPQFSAINVEKVLSRTSSGGVTVNGFFSHYLENRLPFGGVNQSGMGSYHGHFGFKAFSHERAIYVQEKK